MKAKYINPYTYQRGRCLVIVSSLILLGCTKQQNQSLSAHEIFLNEKRDFVTYAKTYDSIAIYINRYYVSCNFFSHKQLYFSNNNTNSNMIETNLDGDFVHIIDSHVVAKMKTANLYKIEIDRIKSNVIYDSCFTNPIKFYPITTYEYEKIIYEYKHCEDNPIDNSRLYKAKIDSLWTIVIEHTGSL